MFTAVSSDIFREVPDRVQIDTTQKRQKTTENQNAMGRQPSLSRTDVGWFIFSLHRRPDLPLDGAHVAFEQFIFCWPLPHVAGSPGRRVLSASLTSARPSDIPRLTGLSGPTGLRLSLMDLPCSHEILWLHASGTNPGSLPDTHRAASGNSAFPIER